MARNKNRRTPHTHLNPARATESNSTRQHKAAEQHTTAEQRGLAEQHRSAELHSRHDERSLAEQMGPAPIVPDNQAPAVPWWRHIVDIPRNLIIGFIKFWRLAISPLYGDVCPYYPTCSAYGLEAVTSHGAIKGSWLTVSRIARCHPWTKGGIDPVPPGKRIWPESKAPKIMVLNHPLHSSQPHTAAKEQSGAL